MIGFTLTHSLTHTTGMAEFHPNNPVIFSLSNRWHSDWYDGEEGPAGGGSHSSPRTRTKARLQIPSWWETKTLFFILIQQPGPGYRGKNTGASRFCNVPDWDVWFRLQWLGSAAPTNGLFIVLFLPPAPYVKVYLLNNGAYVAKKKTKIARKTLDPLYQQALLFEESPQGKVLQVRLYKFLGILTGFSLSCTLFVSVTSGDSMVFLPPPPPPRSLCGATTAEWTIKASWELHKSYWRSWTYQAQLLAGTSCSPPPPSWTRRSPP